LRGQALLGGGVGEGKFFPGYRTGFDVSWGLIARLMVWGLIAGTAWALVGSGNTLFNWARGQYPMLRLSVEPTLITMPLVALVSAATFALTAGGGRIRRRVPDRGAGADRRVRIGRARCGAGLDGIADLRRRNAGDAGPIWLVL